MKFTLITYSAPLREVLSRSPAVYPEGLGIYQDRMPLYINCTEVTHIYTNGSYQLVYQNCTPHFVHNNQVLDCVDLWVPDNIGNYIDFLNFGGIFNIWRFFRFVQSAEEEEREEEEEEEREQVSTDESL